MIRSPQSLQLLTTEAVEKSAGERKNITFFKVGYKRHTTFITESEEKVLGLGEILEEEEKTYVRDLPYHFIKTPQLGELNHLIEELYVITKQSSPQQESLTSALENLKSLCARLESQLITNATLLRIDKKHAPNIAAEQSAILCRKIGNLKLTVEETTKAASSLSEKLGEKEADITEEADPNEQFEDYYNAGDINAAMQYIDKIDVNYDEGLFILRAAQKNDVDMIKLLRSKGANVKLNDALRAAAHKGHQEATRLLFGYLIEEGKAPNKILAKIKTTTAYNNSRHIKEFFDNLIEEYGDEEKAKQLKDTRA